MINFIGSEVGICGEVRVYFELADVSRHIKEEAKPSNPVEELNFAYSADLRREADDGIEHLAEEGDDPQACIRGRTF